MRLEKISLFFMLLATAASTLAAEATLIVGNANGALGSQNNILRIYLKNDVPIHALQLAIADIPDYLRPDSVWTTERTQSFTVSGNDDTTGAFNIILVSFDPQKVITPDSGAILNISYSVDPGAAPFKSLDVIFYLPPTVYNRELGRIPVNTVSGVFTIGETGVEDRPATPAQCRLYQNFPNPFNPGTLISFELPRPENARLSIYNMLGQHIRTLVNAELKAGQHDVVWNGLDQNGWPVAAGVYVYRLEAGTFIENKRMAYMR